MLVYRVENKCQRGPYRNEEFGSPLNLLLRIHSEDGRHPSPYCEGFTKIARLNCGFDSMEQLHNWFSPDELLTMGKAGYLLSTYDCPKGGVQTGQKQIMFDMKCSTLQNTQDLEQVALNALQYN
jgi:hypothetical protein